MNLTKSMRQNKADTIFLKLLKRVRSGKTTTKDVELLMSLHFGKLSEKKKKEIISVGKNTEDYFPQIELEDLQ